MIRIQQENIYRNMFLGAIVLGGLVWWGFKPKTQVAAGEDTAAVRPPEGTGIKQG